MELKKYKLGDIAEILISSIDKKSKEGESPVRLCNFVDVYHNWAITADMVSNFMEATTSEKNIDRFSLKKGYVAFTKDSETRDDIGVPTYIAEDLDNTVLGYHCALVKPDESIILGKYLNAFLHSDYIKRYFELNATGSGMRYTLSVDTLYNIPILAPSLDIQKRIGELFSNIDRKICINRSLNHYLEAMAKQLYDYWFVQFDFPDENGKPYKSSGGKMVWNDKLKREIPEGWSAKSINEITVCVRGVSYDKSDLLNDRTGVLVLRGNNIQDNKLVYDNNVAFIPRTLISQDQAIKKGDIIMTMSSGSKEHIGKCAYFHKDCVHTYGAFLNKYRAIENHSMLLFSFMSSPVFKGTIKNICNGTGINNLTNQNFDSVYMPCPNTAILKKYNTNITPLFEKIGNLDAEIEMLNIKRDELLPLLMTGQVSVKQLNNDL